MSLPTKKEAQEQQENDSTLSTMIVEQINGICCTFDTTNCVLINNSAKNATIARIASF